MYNLDDDFKKYFPQLSFSLKDFQKKVISNVIENGNTLCIMPTGGGKSIIYWMAAMELQGITIVVSPLTALIAEQAEKIQKQGYGVLAIHGDVPASKQMKVLKDFANKKINPRFLFLSPEKIATDGLLEYCLKCRKDDIKLLVIDEVHCVSQWGVSFRPFYTRIPNFMDLIYDTENWVRVLALTATLNPKEVTDICRSFKINKHNIVTQNIMMRSEIQLHTYKFHDEEEKTDKFWEVIKTHRDEKILVYVYRKQGKHSVEDLCNIAQEKGYHAVCFHGDMNAKERMGIIEKYKNNEVNLVFATNAFGMGIDIPDIRVVIHFMIPESVEQYYQEVGRAARDGHGANAYLLYTNKNIDVKKQHFIDRSFPDSDKLRSVYKKIATNVGYQTLAYFDDEEIQQCLPYFIMSGLIQIEGKGFADLASLVNITDNTLQNYYDSTKKKGFIRTINQCSLKPKELTECVYRAYINGETEFEKPLERWLILNVRSAEIDNKSMQLILSDIEGKKKYKHELLDYLVYIIENTPDTLHLHQEIAAYLGTEKHNLALIYETVDGNHVRSKSEVIISNLLYNANIKYEYEEKLFYKDTKWIEPDFTLYVNKKTYYWEHVGMLGKEDYDERWAEKIDIYNQYFPGQMIKTYESGVLSQDVERLIKQII